MTTAGRVVPNVAAASTIINEEGSWMRAIVCAPYTNTLAILRLTVSDTRAVAAAVTEEAVGVDVVTDGDVISADTMIETLAITSHATNVDPTMRNQHATTEIQGRARAPDRDRGAEHVDEAARLLLQQISLCQPSI